MLKRLVLIVLLALAAPALLAAGTGRDVLLTGAGTLYSIESLQPAAELNSTSTAALKLTVQKGEESTSVWIPVSLTGGGHFSPSLAYDSTGDTLFIFWQEMPNPMSSELLFCSYHDGAFSEPTSIENAPFRLRFNLQIGVTRGVEDTDDEGAVSTKPMLLVHAAWWDQTGYGEKARYAMLSIRDGRVVSIDRHDMVEFLANPNSLPAAVPADYNRDIFRHPAIFETPDHDSVDAIFADWTTNRFYRVTIKPVAKNGVLRVPIGVHQREMPAPGADLVASSSFSVMASSGSERVIFYNRTDKNIRYMVFRDGAWSDTVTLSLGAQLSGEAGVEALRRLAAE